MLIKRNTAEFKEIKNLVSDLTGNPSAKKSILIYSLKSYQSLEERILLNTLKKDSAVLYSLAYDSLREYIFSKTKKLFREEKEHIYYFKSDSHSNSIELPFTFNTRLKKNLSKVFVKPEKKEDGKIIPLNQLRDEKPLKHSLRKKAVKASRKRGL